MQPLKIQDVFSWSAWVPEDGLASHSYLFKRPGGNALVDPLPLVAPDFDELRAHGGCSIIVLTSRNHLREALSLQEAFGATIVTTPPEAAAMGLSEYRACSDGEEVFPDAFVVCLKDQQTEGEFALNITKERAVLVGDAVLGLPAGALSLLDDAKYRSAERAGLGLRRLLALNPEILLVGHGTSLFGNAFAELFALTVRRCGAAAYRVNVDELQFEQYHKVKSYFRCLDAEVGFLIGAQKLGYRVATLAPGARFCPLHSHAAEEELFFVLDGEPSVRMLHGTLKCRKGDFIAFPIGEQGTHQLLNESTRDATVVLLARTEKTESCYYPDSDKVVIDAEAPHARGLASLMVRASPVLDYYDGELPPI